MDNEAFSSRWTRLALTSFDALKRDGSFAGVTITLYRTKRELIAALGYDMSYSEQEEPYMPSEERSIPGIEISVEKNQVAPEEGAECNGQDRAS